MLGTRTKQVLSYGRRGRRIVDAPDRTDVFDNENASSRPKSVAMPVRRDPSPLQSPPPKPSFRSRKARKRISSPLSSPQISVKLKPKSKAVARLIPSPNTRPHLSPVRTRQPLGISSPNVPRPSPISFGRTKHKVKKVGRMTGSRGNPLRIPDSPVVDVDIIVLDDAGRRVSQEHRVSRPDVQANPVGSLPIPKRKEGSWVSAIVVSDSEDEVVPETPQPVKRRRTVRPTIVSSDESDVEQHESIIEVSSASTSAVSSVVVIAHKSAFAQPPKRRLHVEVVIPPSPLVPRREPLAPLHNPQLPRPILPISAEPLFKPQPLLTREASPPPPRSKPRQLTPIRRTHSKSLFPRPPSPPSPTTPTDLDLSFDFSQLQLSPSVSQRLSDAAQPAHLVPLLQECGQSAPHEFSAFIETFPYDALVRGDSEDAGHGTVGFQKIGEASYSEVFGIGDVVLKVVPILDPAGGGAGGDEGPAPSDARDVLKEMIVTRAMGELHAGFVRLLRTYVVRGKYPSLLLDLWDEYHARKGSESVRPDMFGGGQVYAIIVLPNGGPDLEACSFVGGGGWQKACSVFWQVARALAEAEDLVAFEHRDLHWGQILVRSSPSTARKGRLPMDDPGNGVKATVIDLGLARMDADEGAVRWTPFEEEVFEGEGDYQFDVYRLMRDVNHGDWESFQPLSNVMWLHYLTLKLLHSKRLRAPPQRKSSAPASLTHAYTERDCYECLVEVRALLEKSLAGVGGKPVKVKVRRKTVVQAKDVEGANVKCAGDLVVVAVERGWLR